MRPAAITPDDAGYPVALRSSGSIVPPRLSALGDPELLDRNASLLAVFCSVRCPGRLILAAHDLAQTMRATGTPVVSGFHSPVEQEFLTVLLRGTGPVVHCPARNLETLRVKPEWRKPLEEGRLLFISRFRDTTRRPTEELARARNELVLALATRVLVAHAAPGGATEALARDAIAAGRQLLTLDDTDNANLIALGARAVRADGGGL